MKNSKKVIVAQVIFISYDIFITQIVILFTIYILIRFINKKIVNTVWRCGNVIVLRVSKILIFCFVR